MNRYKVIRLPSDTDSVCALLTEQLNQGWQFVSWFDDWTISSGSKQRRALMHSVGPVIYGKEWNPGKDSVDDANG